MTFRTIAFAARRLAMPAVAGAFGLAVVSSGAFAQGRPDSFADLAEKLLPAVVNISTTQTVRTTGGGGGQQPQQPQRRPDTPQAPPGSPFEEFFKDFFDRQQQRPESRPRRATSLGSGFIIDPAGLVVTNNHVIADSDEITVILQDETNLKATIVGRDTKTDLALLKVEPTKPLAFVKWGDSDVTRVGDWVVAIGNPFGLGGSVTAGIVSARARDINAGPYDDFLQTDASINRGNSGGPMFNLKGEVIGINTAIYSPSGGSVGIGFAIPASLARPVVEQLRQFGKTKRGWLGVRIQSLTDEIAESIGMTDTKGAMIASISEGGPAEKAKMQQGDVVLRFDGKEVPDMRRLPRIVAETPVGKTVKAEVWRKGKRLMLDITVGELQETEQQAAATPGDKPGRQQAPAERVEVVGMALAQLTDELREKYELGDDVKGVVVTEVKPGTAAAEKGVRAGDVIVEVNQEDVTLPAQVAAKIDQAKGGGRKSVLMLVERQGDLRFVALRLDPAKG